MKNKFGFPAYAIGSILIVAATLCFVIRPASATVATLVPWVFAFGVLFNIVGRILTLPIPNNRRVRRLNGLMALSAILLILAAYLIFKASHLCILAILISAVTDLWFSIRLKAAQDDPKA